MLRGWKTRSLPGVWIVQTSSYQETISSVFALDKSLELDLFDLHLLSAQHRLHWTHR